MTRTYPFPACSVMTCAFALTAMAVVSGPAFAQSAPATGPMTSDTVRISGLIDLSLHSRQLAGETRSQLIESGDMSTSNINFDGQHMMDGGLKTEFALGMFFRADTGKLGRFDQRGALPADSAFARASWVGLSSAEAGSLRLGRQSTTGFLTAIRLSPFGDSVSFGPGIAHTYIGGQSMESPASSGPDGPDSGWSNMINYISPNMGGAVVTLQTTASGTSDSRTGGSISYTSGPLFLALTAENMTGLTGLNGPDRDQKSLQWGGTYDFGPAKVFVQRVVSRQDFAAAPDKKFSTTQLGLTAPWANGTLMTAWGQTQLDVSGGSALDTTRTTLSIGYSKPLSRRTDVYSVLMCDRVTAKSSGTSLAFGLRMRF